MNKLPAKNQVAEAIPPQKQRPLIQRLIRGDLSGKMPLVLAIVWIGLAIVAQVSWAYTIAVLLGLIPLWCLYRFGYQLRVKQLLSEKKYQQAVEVCLKELQSYPDDSFILVSIADAYESLGQHENAEGYAEQAIERGERLSLAYLVQTKIIVHYYLEQQKRLIESSPANAEKAAKGHVTPEELEKEKTRYEAVLQEMDALFRKQKIAPPLLNVTLAFYFARLGMIERAESELEKLEENPDPQVQAYVLSNRARINLLRGQKEIALGISKRARNLLPSDSVVLSTHALVLVRNDQLDEAKASFDSAFKNADTSSQTYWEARYFRAEFFEKLGEASKAQEDKEAALRNGYIPYL